MDEYSPSYVHFFKCFFDKNNGGSICIEAISPDKKSWYFFRLEDQKVVLHPLLVQNKLRKIVIKRTKTIEIDIKNCVHQYFDIKNKFYLFKGRKILSSEEELKILKEKLKKPESKKNFTTRKTKLEKFKEHQEWLVKQNESIEKEIWDKFNKNIDNNKKMDVN